MHFKQYHLNTFFICLSKNLRLTVHENKLSINCAHGNFSPAHPKPPVMFILAIFHRVYLQDTLFFSEKLLLMKILKTCLLLIILYHDLKEKHKIRTGDDFKNYFMIH